MPSRRFELNNSNVGRRGPTSIEQQSPASAAAGLFWISYNCDSAWIGKVRSFRKRGLGRVKKSQCGRST
jgi:hypothetical protein